MNFNKLFEIRQGKNLFGKKTNWFSLFIGDKELMGAKDKEELINFFSEDLKNSAEYCFSELVIQAKDGAVFIGRYYPTCGCFGYTINRFEFGVNQPSCSTTNIKKESEFRAYLQKVVEDYNNAC